jgi:phenylalanyl-tRNA synthetase alpha chain
MKEKIESLLKEIHSFNAETIEELESFRIKFLGKKGFIPAMFADFKSVPPRTT